MADQGTEAGQAYADRMLTLLGDDDPLDLMEGTPQRLSESAQHLSSEAVRTPEAPGKWSIAGVLRHMADVEWVLGFRYRLLAAEDGCRLPLMQEAVWAEAYCYNDAAPGPALRDFELLRRMNLRFLASVQPPQWRHTGTHPERGRESLDRMVRLYAGHDRCHLLQIARIRAALRT